MQQARAYSGWCWIGHTKRPIYSIREITRGKNKGKFWVSYLHGVSTEGENKGNFYYRKVMVLKDDILGSDPCTSD